MGAIILQFCMQSVHARLQINTRLCLMPTALFNSLPLMQEYQVPFFVHLILDGVSKNGDENGGKILLRTKFGSLDVRIGLFIDEDVRDFVVSEVEVVLE